MEHVRLRTKWHNLIHGVSLLDRYLHEGNVREDWERRHGNWKNDELIVHMEGDGIVEAEVAEFF